MHIIMHSCTTQCTQLYNTVYTEYTLTRLFANHNYKVENEKYGLKLPRSQEMRNYLVLKK